MEGTITAIEPQQRRGGKRVNVFLEHRYALSIQIELADSLKVGQFISSATFGELCGRDERARAMDAALHFLGHRPRSEREIRTRLQSKGYSPEILDAIVARLAELKLIDDAAFATYWVEQRQGRAPRGRRLINQELRQKGVDAAVIEQASSPSVDDADLAYRAGLKKARSLALLDERTFRQRLGGFLQRQIGRAHV